MLRELLVAAIKQYSLADGLRTADKKDTSPASAPRSKAELYAAPRILLNPADKVSVTNAVKQATLPLNAQLQLVAHPQLRARNPGEATRR